MSPNLKRRLYKVSLRLFIRRAGVPVLLVVTSFWVCAAILFHFRQSEDQWNTPPRVRSARPRLDRHGFYARDRGEFARRYSPDQTLMNGSTALREFLLYGSIENMEDFPELGGILAAFSRGLPGAYRRRASVACPGRERTVVGVTVSTRLEEFPAKDAVIFGVMPKTLGPNLKALIGARPARAQTWVYASTESPLRALRWVKDPDLASLGYHKLMTYNAQADIPLPFGYAVARRDAASSIAGQPHHQSTRPGNLTGRRRKKKRKLMAWAASNCEEVFWPRNEFVERIRELVPVDTYGRCGAVDCLPRGSRECQRIFSGYKFYLALANSECRDYITEKFWGTALRSGIVPVVGGAPREDFERVAPSPDSFIHIADFRSVGELVGHLLRLDADDALYGRHLEWRRTVGVAVTFPPGPDLFCRVLPHLVPGSAPDRRRRAPALKRLGESPWYQTCRNEVSISSAVRVRARVLDNKFDSWTPWRLQ